MAEGEIETLMQQGKWQEALGLCAQELRQRPGSAKLNGLLGMCYFRQKKYAESLEPFRRAVTLDPGFWEIGIRYAQALEFEGQREEAYTVACEWNRVRPGHPTLEGLIEHLEYRIKGNRSEIWEKTRGLNREVLLSDTA
ncbi:MAG: tetratricopeptide repeat protein [Fimbriimonas sp.]